MTPTGGPNFPLGFKTPSLSWWVCSPACRLCDSLDAQNDAPKSGKHPGPCLKESASVQGLRREQSQQITLTVSVRSITNYDESGLVFVFNKYNFASSKPLFGIAISKLDLCNNPHEVNEASKRGLVAGRDFRILSLEPVTQAKQTIYQQVCAEIRSGMAQLLPVLLTNCIGRTPSADQPADPCPLVLSKDSASCQENPIQA